MKTGSLLAALVCGALFGLGLSVSSMVRPEVVLDFLRFRDFGLLLVLGGAMGVTMAFYQLAPRLMRKPVLEGAFGKHPSVLNGRTIGGAALFGIGWGISGVCPGPAIAGLGTGNWPLLLAVAGLFAGAYVQGRWFAAAPG
ncbi:MAG: YeeE/YedE family protein [Burkholderiales bacterium]|nr:YeeE/YedE family protein [Burkholderiales bacterium]